MKRILDCQASDFAAMRGRALKQAIRAGEGRTLLAEVILSWPPLLGDVSNAELARAFGADLILLNFFDMDHPRAEGLPEPAGDGVVAALRRLTGRPVGVNLEPVDPAADMAEDRVDIPPGRRLTAHTAARLCDLGFDFVCLTGNPKTGVSHPEIARGIRMVREVCGEDVLVIAGKMHAAGTKEPFDEDTLLDLGTRFVESGADVVLFPAPGTVPGVTREMLRPAIAEVHRRGGLVMLAVGTSQEGSDEATVRQLALESKMAGADIFHLGDAGYPGVTLPENLLAASIALRGRRHAYRRMAASVLR
ncbi:PEP phosphonomutase [Alicyclobacillus macrosporangiidus]|uniref:DUF7916 domain-containing protein n=1 Tax=Alicyclobacillus macrosporangiidus TaxID=392015 RepID=A0A1I7GYZ5_9BACL|nr:PEP phosphonomutase [Alicyclobacillus macrosporangiidus]SFU53635.1 hypothetical protein SAMN05421543_103138 [Alicyclobacillus macrosporangiidus]